MGCGRGVNCGAKKEKVMGFYAVDVIFDCTATCGVHLDERIQTMDAFIGYEGPGPMPPALIKIGPDLLATDARTGEVFDPVARGYDQDWEWFEDSQGRTWRVTIRAGAVTIQRDEG
jgi:hypothetical protein